MPDPTRLHSGSPADFDDSMAEAIDKAYNELRIAAGMDPLPTTATLDRHMLFMAIARGVINHLYQHQQAFSVTVQVNSIQGTGTLAIQVKDPPPP